MPQGGGGGTAIKLFPLIDANGNMLKSTTMRPNLHEALEVGEVSQVIELQGAGVRTLWGDQQAQLV